MWHEGLREEIVETFERLSTAVALEDVAKMHLHRHAGLSTSKLTTGARGQSPEQKREKRRELETNRREYKARKARESYARRKAA